jgi:hypothetical protein
VATTVDPSFDTWEARSSTAWTWGNYPCLRGLHGNPYPTTARLSCSLSGRSAPISGGCHCCGWLYRPGTTARANAASAAWLGKHAPHIAVASSGLWNVRHVADQYEPRTLEVLAAYVEAQPVSETGECQSFELAIRKPEPSSVSARQCRLRYSTQGVSSHCRWRAKKTTRSSIRWNAGPGSATRSTQTMASRQPPTPVPLVERRAETGGAGRSFVPQMQRFAVIVPVGRTSAAGRVVNRLLLRWPMGSLPAGRPQL